MNINEQDLERARHYERHVNLDHWRYLGACMVVSIFIWACIGLFIFWLLA